MNLIKRYTAGPGVVDVTFEVSAPPAKLVVTKQALAHLSGNAILSASDAAKQAFDQHQQAILNVAEREYAKGVTTLKREHFKDASSTGFPIDDDLTD